MNTSNLKNAKSLIILLALSTCLFVSCGKNEPTPVSSIGGGLTGYGNCPPPSYFNGQGCISPQNYQGGGSYQNSYVQCHTYYNNSYVGCFNGQYPNATQGYVSVCYQVYDYGMNRYREVYIGPYQYNGGSWNYYGTGGGSHLHFSAHGVGHTAGSVGHAISSGAHSVNNQVKRDVKNVGKFFKKLF